MTGQLALALSAVGRLPGEATIGPNRTTLGELLLGKKCVRFRNTWQPIQEGSPFDHLYLNCDGEPPNEWGVQGLLWKCCRQVGVATRVMPHSLRRTFASDQAQSGLSPFQPKERPRHRARCKVLCFWGGLHQSRLVPAEVNKRYLGGPGQLQPPPPGLCGQA